MRPDIVNLRQFYSSPLGRKVKTCLRRMMQSRWSIQTGEHVLGIGYTTPVLRALERAGAKPACVVALMPASQGAMYWPVHAENRSILGDEMRPPFMPQALSHIIVMHLFEYAPQPDALLRVLWQLLAPGGQLLLVVPNRRGLWARLGATPFATGTPYTIAAIKTLLRDAEFTLRDTGSTLFAPPSAHPFWLRSWGVLEWLGRLTCPHRGGVLVIEAEKQIYAAVGTRAPVTTWQKSPQGVGAY